MFLVSCSAFLWRYESLEVDTPRLIHNKTRVGNVSFTRLKTRQKPRTQHEKHAVQTFCTELLTSYPMNDMRNFWRLIRKICVMILETNG